MNFRINNKIYEFKFNVYKTDSIIGIGSVCQDDKHCLFLDLDNTSLIKARSIIKKLQKEYKLSHGFLLKSSENNYHGVFFDKLDFIKTVEIQSLVNRKHSGMTMIKGDSTIRLSSKFYINIKFINFIESDFNNNEISKAHLLTFIEHFNLNINFTSKFLKLDDSNKIKYYCYEKRVKL